MLLKELLGTYVGQLSLGVIVFMIVMMGFIVRMLVVKSRGKE